VNRNLVDKAFQYTWHEAVKEGLREPGFAKIMVLGVGGAGNNTVNRLMETGIIGAECVAINTDRQHLDAVHACHKFLIGEKTTRGLGAGADPYVGRMAMEESKQKISSFLHNADVIFIAAGMGGGTGTAAAPIIAEMGRERGAIVVGVVTMPFRHERARLTVAAQGLSEMRRFCDTVVVIDNNKLMELVPQLPINEAFNVADGILANMVGGITNIISMPSLINLDFADFRTIIRRGGLALVGIGESDAPNRAEEAVRSALQCPLLDVNYDGAHGALIHVSGNDSLTLAEASQVAEIVTERLDEEALVIWGARIDERLDKSMKVTLVLTGIDSPYIYTGYTGIPSDLDNAETDLEFDQRINLDLRLEQLET
jgi:cell division protein FtsZ